MKNFKTFSTFNLTASYFALFLLVFGATSCGSDDDVVDPVLETSSYEYQLHNGQTVGSAPYSGTHNDDYAVTMELEELANGNTMITLSLMNTVNGASYNLHAHDVADPSTTPNGTPYNESPNTDIFAQSVQGNGGTVTISQEANISYFDLTNTYDGFFVSHDPLQEISTTDISTYLVVAAFARTQTTTNYDATTFTYDFNSGQISPNFLYVGNHPNNLSATIRVAELASGSRITVTLNNTLDGETYPTHAHDAADPLTTPNNTPYNETPNGEVYAGALMGNGGTVALANISSMTYDEITASYDGFFVVHDPLQAVDTTDPTTYIVLGLFAR